MALYLPEERQTAHTDHHESHDHPHLQIVTPEEQRARLSHSLFASYADKIAAASNQPLSPEQQAILDFALEAYSLTDDDIDTLTQEIQTARVASYEAAYDEASGLFYTSAAYVETQEDDDTDPENPEDEGTDDQEDTITPLYGQDLPSYDHAEGIADTYHSSLGGQIMNLLQWLPIGGGEAEGAAALTTMAAGVSDWAARNASYKAGQIANAEAGQAANDGTNAFVDDILNSDWLDSMGLSDADVYVTVLPEYSFEDSICGDFAGEVFSLDQYYEIPEYPAHPNCYHEKVIVLKDAELADMTPEEVFGAQDAINAAGADIVSRMQDAADFAGMDEEEAAAAMEAGMPNYEYDKNIVYEIGQQTPAQYYPLMASPPPPKVDLVALQRKVVDARHAEAEAGQAFGRLATDQSISHGAGSLWAERYRDWRATQYDRERAEALVRQARGSKNVVVHLMQYDGLTDEQTARVLRETFGHDLSPDEIASLVGAPDGSYVEVYASDASGKLTINLEVAGPSFDPIADLDYTASGLTSQRMESEYYADRHLTRTASGALVMTNENFFINDVALQGKGLGSTMFAEEARSLSDLGVSKITTHAGGAFGEGVNGYYTWPRLGYTGKVPDDVVKVLKEAAERGDVPAAWGKYTTVQQLMKTPAGRDWWKLNGHHLDLEFSLKPTSSSMKVLDKYIAERQAQAALRTAAEDFAKGERDISDTAKAKIQEIGGLQTTRDALKWMRAEFPSMTVDLPATADVQNVKEAARALVRLRDQYAEAFGELRYVGATDTTTAKRYLKKLFTDRGETIPAQLRAFSFPMSGVERTAGVTSYGNGILLDAATIRDRAAYLATAEREVSRGFWMGDATKDYGYVVTHEFGHVLQTALAGTENVSPYLASRVSRESRQAFRQWLDDTRAAKDTLPISAYARKNEWEYWAEAFATQRYGSEAQVADRMLVRQREILESAFKGADLPASEHAIEVEAAARDPKAIMRDVKPDKDWVKGIQTDTRADIKTLAAKHDMTVGQYKSAVARQVKTLMRDAQISIDVPDAVVSQILESGRLKSVFETGESTVGDLSTRQSYMKARSTFEERAFGYPKDLDPINRPIYGYYREFQDQAQYHWVNVILKDSVRERATITIGDSLGEVRVAPTPFAKPTIDSVPFHNGVYGALQDPLDARSFDDLSKMSSEFYVEAQVHGGVTLSDIKEIVFGEGHAPDIATVNALAERGIPWRMASEAVPEVNLLASGGRALPDASEILRSARDYDYIGKRSAAPYEASDDKDKTEAVKRLSKRLKGNKDYDALVDSMLDRVGIKRTPERAEQTMRKLLEGYYGFAEGGPQDITGFSNVNNDLRVAFHQAVQDEFNLDAPIYVSAAERQSMAARYGDVMSGVRAFVRAIYDETQAELKSQGITELTLYRGSRWKASHLPDGLIADGYSHRVVMDMQPMSAWTTNLDVSLMYANQVKTGEYGAITATKIPAERVFSLSFTGFGVRDQGEVVLLGGKADAVTVAKQAEHDYAYGGYGQWLDRHGAALQFSNMVVGNEITPRVNFLLSSDRSAAELHADVRAAIATQEQAHAAYSAALDRYGMDAAETKAALERWNDAQDAVIEAHGTWVEAVNAEEAEAKATEGAGARIFVKYDTDGRAALTELAGERLSWDDVGGLVGAQPGDRVEVFAKGQKVDLSPGGVEIHLKGDHYEAIRGVMRDANGDLVAINYTFGVDAAYQGQGIGARVFADQVKSLSDRGFVRIETTASRIPGTHNGYYTWLRLGYDAPMTATWRARLPAEWRDIKTLSEVLDKPGGAAWWKTNGWSFNGTFDLSEGSRSHDILDAYLHRAPEINPLLSSEATPAFKTDLPSARQMEREAKREIRQSEKFEAKDSKSDTFTIAPKLLDRLGDTPEWQRLQEVLQEKAKVPKSQGAYGSIHRLIVTWNGGGDGSLLVAMQQAVKEEFGLTAELTYKKGQITNATRIYGDVQDGLRQVMRAFYDITQADFAERGVTDLTLYRGLHWTEQKTPKDLLLDGKVHEIVGRLHPVSSFSADLETAYSFAFLHGDAGDTGMLTAVRVPVGRIISGAATGLGTTFETEYLVLGGEDKVLSISRTVDQKEIAENTYQAAFHQPITSHSTLYGEFAAGETEPPAPKPAEWPKKWSDLDGYREVTGPAGSQEGRWLEAPDGTRYYDKPAHTPAHASNEVGAMTAYRILGGAEVGVDIPETRVLKEPAKDGAKAQSHIVSREIHGLRQEDEAWWRSDASKATREQAEKLWAYDVFFSHYDVVGIGQGWDNLLVDASGKPVRIEAGGAMKYGGLGGLKATWKPGSAWDEPWRMRGITRDGLKGDGRSEFFNGVVFGGISDERAAQLLHDAGAQIEAKLPDLEAAWKAEKMPAAQIKQNVAVLRDRLERAPEVEAELRGLAPKVEYAKVEGDPYSVASMAAERDQWTDIIEKSVDSTPGGAWQQRQDVSARVAKRLQSSKPFQALAKDLDKAPEELALELHDAWSAGGGRSHDDLVALRNAAKAEFKLKVDTLPFDRAEAEERYKQHVKGYRAYIKAMYQETQDFFAKYGIEEVTVYRGLGWREGFAPEGDWQFDHAGWRKFDSAALSSWTLSPYVAENFANSGAFAAQANITKHMFLAERVPVKDLLSIPLTGFGTPGEREVALLGGRREAVVVAWDGAKTRTTDELLQAVERGAATPTVAEQQAIEAARKAEQEAQRAAQAAAKPASVEHATLPEVTARELEAEDAAWEERLQGGVGHIIDGVKFHFDEYVASVRRIADTLKDNAAWQKYLADTKWKPSTHMRIDTRNGTRYTQKLDTSESMVSRLIDSWNADGGNETAEAVMFQLAARDEFGIDGRATFPRESLTEGKQLYKQYGEAMRAVARAVYDETQAYLAEQGITEVTLYRGRSWSKMAKAPKDMAWDKLGHKITVDLAPISSFATSADEAVRFAHGIGPGGHMVIATRVPVADIFSVSLHGFGSEDEAEMLVFGHPQRPAWSVAWKGTNWAAVDPMDIRREIAAASRDLKAPEVNFLLSSSEDELPLPQRITVLHDERSADAIADYFGPHMTNAEIGGLVGAQDGATVTLTASPGIMQRFNETYAKAGEEARLLLTLDGGVGNYYAQRAIFEDMTTGKLFMRNSYIRVDKTGTGLGTRIFADEVQTLKARGFDRIETMAERDVDMNSYYTWARLGYDGPIGPYRIDDLPPAWQNLTSISQILDQPGGLAWWKANGWTFNGVFDLNDGSKSLRTLDAYLGHGGEDAMATKVQPLRVELGSTGGGGTAAGITSDEIRQGKETYVALGAGVDETVQQSAKLDRLVTSLNQDDGWRSWVERRLADQERDIARFPEEAANRKTFEQMSQVETIRMLNAWAETSIDSDLAKMIQIAVEREFGMDESLLYGVSEYERGRAQRAWGDAEPAIRAWVRAVYHDTQTLLKERGITEVTVLRGMKLPQYGDQGPHVVGIQSRPLSSWTMDAQTAHEFVYGLQPTGGYGDGVIVAMKAPAERVFSTWHTGIGTLRETEIVLLGGRDEVAALGGEAARASNFVEQLEAASKLLPPETQPIGLDAILFTLPPAEPSYTAAVEWDMLAKDASREEVDHYLALHFGDVDIALGEMSAENARNVAYALTVAADADPLAFSRIKRVVTTDDPLLGKEMRSAFKRELTDQTIALHAPYLEGVEGSTIILNAAVINDPVELARIYRVATMSKLFAPWADNLAASVIHEEGHAVSFWLAEHPDARIRSAYQALMDRTWEYRLSKHAEWQISIYARIRNDQEYFAEAYQAAKVGSDAIKEHPYVMQLQDLLDAAQATTEEERVGFLSDVERQYEADRSGLDEHLHSTMRPRDQIPAYNQTGRTDVQALRIDEEPEKPSRLDWDAREYNNADATAQWIADAYPQAQVALYPISAAHMDIIANQMGRLVEDAPEVAKRVVGIVSTQDPAFPAIAAQVEDHFESEVAGSIAWTYTVNPGEFGAGPDGGILLFVNANKAKFPSGLDFWLKFSRQDGLFARWMDGLGAVLDHEEAHIIGDALDHSANEELRETYQGLMATTPMYMDAIHWDMPLTHISGYAEIDEYEFFAEAYLASRSAPQEVRDLSYVQQVRAIIDAAKTSDPTLRAELLAKIERLHQADMDAMMAKRAKREARRAKTEATRAANQAKRDAETQAAREAAITASETPAGEVEDITAANIAEAQQQDQSWRQTEEERQAQAAEERRQRVLQGDDWEQDNVKKSRSIRVQIGRGDEPPQFQTLDEAVAWLHANIGGDFNWMLDGGTTLEDAQFAAATMARQDARRAFRGIGELDVETFVITPAERPIIEQPIELEMQEWRSALRQVPENSRGTSHTRNVVTTANGQRYFEVDRGAQDIRNEIDARTLATLIGIPDLVQPIKIMESGGQQYVLTRFLEDARPLDNFQDPASIFDLKSEEWKQRNLLFEYLLGDGDPNLGNVMVTRDGRLIRLDFEVGFSVGLPRDMPYYTNAMHPEDVTISAPIAQQVLLHIDELRAIQPGNNYYQYRLDELEEAFGHADARDMTWPEFNEFQSSPARIKRERERGIK